MDIQGNQGKQISNLQFSQLSKRVQSYKQGQVFLPYKPGGKNIFQYLLFTWVAPLLQFGNKNQLKPQHFPPLERSDGSDIGFQKLKKIFYVKIKKKKSNAEGFRLAESILLAFQRQFIIVFLCSVITTSVQMYQPILNYQVINYASQPQQKQVEASLYYFVQMCGINLFIMIGVSFLFYYIAMMGYTISNSVSLLIFDKALKYPILSQKQYSVSDIINYSQIDAAKVASLGSQIITLIYTPIQILVGLFMLYTYTGISFIAGVTVMLFIMLIKFGLSKIIAGQFLRLIIAKDKRLKIANQIIQIIRFIKINALQKVFYNKIDKKRQQQLQTIRSVNNWSILNSFITQLCPTLITCFTFITNIYLGSTINSATVFFTINVFNILKNPIQLFPGAISQIIQIWQSLKRIQKFLTSPQILENKIICQNKRQHSIQICSGNFYWGEFKKSIIQTKQENNKYILSQINIEFAPKQLKMIIGDIGSGKSSLLYAILNQMKPNIKNKFNIKINGSIAFVAQNAWLMAGTIKQNIVFYEKLDQQRLKQAIYYACLEDDIKLMNKGIDTQIGEKGVNLSGGQKARISLARALYSNKDIYLLDDILSAVDVHVGQFLMENTIMKYLKNKTVIMPTHAVKYLRKAHSIVIIKKGKIVAHKSYGYIKHCQIFKEMTKILTINQLKKQDLLQKQRKQNKFQQNKEHIQTKIQVKDTITSQNSKIFSENKEVSSFLIAQNHNKGEVPLSIYFQYIKLNGGQIFLFFLIICMIGWIFLSMKSNMQIQNWSLNPNNDINCFYQYIGLAFLACVISCLKIYIVTSAGVKYGRTVHKSMMKSLLYASLIRFYNRVPVGRILSRLSSDLSQIEGTIGSAFAGTLSCLFSLIASLIICIHTSSIFVIGPVIGIAIICIQFTKYYLKTQRQCVRQLNITNSRIVSAYISAINGLQTIRAYKVTDKFLLNQIKKVNNNKTIKISKQGVQNWFILRLAAFSFIINMLTLAFCLFYQSQKSALTGLLLTYSTILNSNIVMFVFSYAHLQLQMIAIQRVKAFTELKPQQGYVQYCQKQKSQKQKKSHANVVNEGIIQFRNYSTRYADQMPFVLNNISLKIQKGQKIGIVGRTGSGKSTLINCILGILKPFQGSILIDNKQLRSYPLRNLRSSISTIDQQPVIINGSFLQNFDPTFETPAQEIKEMINLCQISDLIQQKGGLSAIISNQSLSVGQKQIICLCRCLLKKNKIVLIDQATANIDTKHDKLIQQIISHVFKNSTILTIAHRISTLQNYDKILVLGDGKVLEWGKRQQLLKIQNGQFRKLYEQKKQQQN